MSGRSKFVLALLLLVGVVSVWIVARSGGRAAERDGHDELASRGSTERQPARTRTSRADERARVPSERAPAQVEEPRRVLQPGPEPLTPPVIDVTPSPPPGGIPPERRERISSEPLVPPVIDLTPVPPRGAIPPERRQVVSNEPLVPPVIRIDGDVPRRR